MSNISATNLSISGNCAITGTVSLSQPLNSASTLNVQGITTSSLTTTGVVVYNVLPTSAIVPTLPNQFITKAYCDTQNTTQDVLINSLVASGQSLNTLTATQGASINSLNTLTATQGASINSLNTLTATQGASINSLNTLTATQGNNINDLYAITAEHDTSITNIESLNVSQGISISNLNILTSSQGNSITNIQSINATQDNSINSVTTRVNTIEPKVTNMSFSNNNTSFSGGATFLGSTRFVGSSVFSNLPSIAYTSPVDFTLFTPFQDEQFVSKYYVDRIQKRTFGPSYIPSIRYGSKTTSSTGETTCDFLSPFPLQHNISPVNLLTTLLYSNTTLLAGPVTVYITFLDSNRFRYQVKCLINGVYSNCESSVILNYQASQDLVFNTI